MSTQRLDRLDQLATMLHNPALALVQAVDRDLKLKLFIVFTWRSSQEQDRLFQQGREFSREEGIWRVADKDKVVTDAPAGKSAHNIVTLKGAPASMAMDVIPMTPEGTLLWDTTMEMWRKIWDLAWKFGFDPLGDAIGAYLKNDLGHLEEPAWKQKLAGLGLVQPTSDLLRSLV